MKTYKKLKHSWSEEILPGRGLASLIINFMKYDTKKKASLVLIFSFLALYTCTKNLVESHLPIVRKGVLDLRNFDFRRIQKIPIKGEWEFYWKYLYKGDNSAIPTVNTNFTTHYVHIPGVWNGKIINGEKLNGEGYATFRVKIYLPQQKETKIAISFPRNIYAVHSIWINGSKKMWNGIPGDSPEKTNFIEHNLFDYLILDSDTIDLIVVLANFRGNTRWGGIRETFEIGYVSAIHSEIVKKRFFSIFIFSFILAVGIYHQFFFWNYSRDKLPLFFSFLCVAVSFYSLITSFTWLDLFPTMNPSSIFRLEFLLELIFTPLFYSFFRLIFPEDFSSILHYACLLISGIFIFVNLFFPIEVISSIYVYSLYIPLIFGTYILFTIVRSFILKRNFSGLILLSVVILFIFMLNDVLSELIDFVLIFRYSFPLALLIFILFHSFIISKMQADAFKKAEQYLILQNQYNLQALSQTEERARIARDIHDSIGSEIASLIVSLDSKNLDSADLTQKIRQQLSAVLINIRDIVYLLGQNKKKHEILEKEIEKYLNRLISTNQYRVEYRIDMVSNSLDMEQSLNLQRVFLEIMAYIIQHSKAKSIFVGLSKKKRTIRLIVTNDGEPFLWKPGNKLPEPMNLEGLYLRVSKLKGRVRFFHLRGFNLFILSLKL